MELLSHYPGLNEIKDKIKERYPFNRPGRLIPCEKIGIPELNIGLLGGNNLHARHFELRRTDHTPILLYDRYGQIIYRLTHPGKSGFVYLGDEKPDKTILNDLTPDVISRDPTRHDRLHLTTVGKLQESGWSAWWAPLRETKNWLHVRIVGEAAISERRTPNLEELSALCGAFARVI